MSKFRVMFRMFRVLILAITYRSTDSAYREQVQHDPIKTFGGPGFCRSCDRFCF